MAGYFRTSRYRHAKRNPRLKDRPYLTAPAGLFRRLGRRRQAACADGFFSAWRGGPGARAGTANKRRRPPEPILTGRFDTVATSSASGRERRPPTSPDCAILIERSVIATDVSLDIPDLRILRKAETLILFGQGPSGPIFEVGKILERLDPAISIGHMGDTASTQLGVSSDKVACWPALRLAGRKGHASSSRT